MKSAARDGERTSEDVSHTLIRRVLTVSDHYVAHNYSHIARLGLIERPHLSRASARLEEPQQALSLQNAVHPMGKNTVDLHSRCCCLLRVATHMVLLHPDAP